MQKYVAEWLEAKEAERKAVDRRREIEDLLTESLKPTIEGTSRYDLDGYTVKITGRVNRKVDTDKLMQIARENDLEVYTQTLFRWSADISATAWKNTHTDITDKLAPAVTTTPGRPSYAITKENE